MKDHQSVVSSGHPSASTIDERLMAMIPLEPEEWTQDDQDIAKAAAIIQDFRKRHSEQQRTIERLREKRDAVLEWAAEEATHKQEADLRRILEGDNA